MPKSSKHHVESLVNGDVDEVISDFAANAVILCGPQPIKGSEAIRAFFSGVSASFDGFALDVSVGESDHHYIAWHERSYQMERGGSWDKGKSFVTFGPLGSWLVTSDEVPGPQDLSIWLDVNGTRRQASSTASMIFDVKTIVSYVSNFLTLRAGDVIATGTPAGVGMGIRPEPVLLRAGDEVRLGIDGLGEQRQRYIPWN